MMRKHVFLMNLFFLVLVACNSSYESIEKIPIVINKYDPNQPTKLESIDPTYGVIDQTFIVNGNFPGDTSNIKVYFGTKRAIITANNGISITGIVPKQPDGYNQVSMVIGKDSIVPDGMKFKYRQSKSVKTIAGKLGTENWLSDASYAGAAIDAVTFGEVHYVATVAGQKNDNILVLETGWGNRLFMLSLDDNRIQKLPTPTNLSSMAVASTRDKFYATRYHDGDRAIYMYSKENNWSFKNTGITILRSDYPGVRVPSMTFAENDNLLYVLDVEGRIAEVNIAEKSYKIYTTADKKPSNVDATNFGGLITGPILPSNFGDWEDSYITYSKYHKCFFVSYTYEQAIYKYVKNADNTWTCTLYAGKNGQGSTVGDRLKDAQFNKPHGLVVNADGDILVCNKGNQPWDGQGHSISRISKNAVEILAGKTNSNNPLLNGLPLESTFNTPRNLAIDFEGNYYIAGGNDYTVRKLSIE
jgi:hypothetical protein